jgi:hypothetical protein
MKPAGRRKERAPGASGLAGLEKDSFGSLSFQLRLFPDLDDSPLE